MKKIILLKLGGSLITDKSKPFTLMEKNIRRIAIEIKEAYLQDPTILLIIGTGTGSFGHYSAQKFNIKEGLRTDMQRYGFCSIHHTAQELNHIVAQELINVGLKTFSLHPSSMMMAKDGKITQFFYEPIINLLKIGIMPVVHGDVIADEKIGSCICSIEDIFRELIVKLHASKTYQYKVIYAGSTDGVLDKENNTIPLITESNFSRIQSSFFQTRGYDVTGGMKTKVKECFYLTKYNVTSTILNGAIKNTIRDFLLGKHVRGTVIQ